MGQPARPGKRKTIVLSSDEEKDDDETTKVEEEIISDSEQEVTNPQQTRATTTLAEQLPRSTRSSTQQPKTLKSTKTTTTSKNTSSQSQSSKTSKTKPTTSSEQPKRGNKSIYSFFNAATQRQQSQQQPIVSSGNPPQASQEAFHEDTILDDISGDDDDAGSVHFSKSSNTALALRKRKLQKDEFETTGSTEILPAATQKFRKVSDGTKTSAALVEDDRRPWTERFAPVNLAELAVHKKKLQDVRNVIDSALSNRAVPRLIVLKGPAGSAKTATVNLIAKDIGAEIVEWKNPAGSDGSSSTFLSASAQFEEFVLRGAQFAGLQLVTGDDVSEGITAPDTGHFKPQILVIEEFPNTFARASTLLQSFRSTIQQFLATPRSSISKPTPLIMIISEALLSTSMASADSFTAHRLLGPQILTHPQTALIEFNPVATTILTKALELIVVKESRRSGRRKTPGPQVLKHIAETGDIRSAVSSLEFLCLKGDDGDSWSAKVAFTKPRGSKREAPLTKQEQEALKLISNRESSLGIFHAVGKVAYNKRQDPEQPVPQPPTHLPQHRRPKIPEVDVDVLIIELGTDTSTFIAALHENYALSCNSNSNEDALDSLNGCLDALSDSDLLSQDRFGFGARAFSGSAQDNLRQDDMSFQTAVRGILFALPSPVNRGEGGRSGSSSSGGKVSGNSRIGDAFRMFYPASLKMWKRIEETKGTLDLVLQTFQNGVTLGRKGGGVESWKREVSSHADEAREKEEGASHGPSSSSSSSSALPFSLSAISSSAKTEMLLDRLPYTATILTHKKDTPQSLLSNMAVLTSFQSGGGAEAVGDADDDGDEYGFNDSIDEVLGMQNNANNTIGSRQRRRSKELEGGGLHLPVEHAVEKLVLSDDDIED